MDQKFTIDRIQAALSHLKKLCIKYKSEISEIYIGNADYNFSENIDLSGINFEKFERNRTWGGQDRHFYFKCDIDASQGVTDEPLILQLETGASDIWNTDNPQILLYKNNELTGTMDMNHRDIMLTDSLKDGDVFHIVFYAYSNYSTETCFFHVNTIVPSNETIDIYYDIKTIFDATVLLGNDDIEKIRGLEVLNQAVNIIDFRNPHSDIYKSTLDKARKFLLKEYFNKNHKSPITVYSVGFTHIDVAWKWRVKQTRQKAVRSFLTVLNLMEKYPEYRFMSSTPLLYEFVKEDAPNVYKRILERIAEGRWEAEGATWLEPDINLISGESIIRHFLYGRKFFSEELKAGRSKILWLPDVFGFSPVLPQIMKQFDVKYFVTTKTGWNDSNRFPNDTFIWRGMNGSRVLGYIITTKNYNCDYGMKPEKDFSSTYNGLQNPAQIAGTWQRYQNKELSQDVLTCFGYGDGGGGPNEEMLLTDRRLSMGVGRVPRTRQALLREFFKKLEENINGKDIPVWSGEIYLEYHRGTYTSQGRNKRSNRKLERMLLDTEILAAMSEKFNLNDSYKAEMERNWKLLLLNQFHDILPGSSIGEVYEDSKKDYERLYKSLKNIQTDILIDDISSAESANSIAIWNTIGFKRTVLYESDNKLCPDYGCQRTYDDKYLYLFEDISPLSFEIRELECDKDFTDFNNVLYNEEITGGVISGFETVFYKIKFNEFGEMISIYDKSCNRELVKSGKVANSIAVYEDIPKEYSAWNTEIYYKEKYFRMEDVEEVSLVENGPLRAVIRIRRNFEGSKLCQYICFYSYTGRIDFKTELEWYEHETLVKVHFPMDIQCERARYDIQFGNIERSNYNNTSWDRAQFEVPAHKWADISEADYGVALLNDCKYGYSVKESDMSLTLLKSGIFPDKDADMGHHKFVYALFPHKGDFRKGNVIREGYILNSNIYIKPVSGMTPVKYEFAKSDSESIVIEAVKYPEEGDNILVRMYECHGGRCNARLEFGKGWNIYKSDMTELAGDCLGKGCREIDLMFYPYEIKTIILERVE